MGGPLDHPAWLTDKQLLDHLEQLGEERLRERRKRRREPSKIDRREQTGAGFEAVDPDVAGVYWVDEDGIPLGPSDHDDDALIDDLHVLLRGLLPAEQARILRSMADRMDPRPPKRTNGGQPPSTVDPVAVRETYRRRVHVNTKLRAAVLASDSRPSEQALDELATSRIVFSHKEYGGRVMITDRHWPAREALTYLAAQLALSIDRVRALIKPR